MAFELWQAEFGASYAVPREVLTTKGITDDSWHNDICPSFIWTALDNNDPDTLIKLWVDHVDPQEREGGPDAPRFMVTIGQDAELETDDVSEALALFALLREKRLQPGLGDACADCERSYGPGAVCRCGH
jgi:hypothetical protein